LLRFQDAATEADMASIYEEITNQVIAGIEAGMTGRCPMPWRRLFHANIEGRPYRGMNAIILGMAAQRHGFASTTWGTFKAWLASGNSVRKGAKGIRVVFYKTQDEDDADAPRRMLMRSFVVFNAEQTENPPVEPDRPKIEVDSAVQEAVRRMGVLVVGDSPYAAYAPKTDCVFMPPAQAFETSESYNAVLLHELGHATGHEKRLARDFKGRFGDAAYAFEELVAELSASFCCAQLGIEPELRRDHIMYIASWLKVLRNDKRAIFTAASKAQAAADLIIGKQEAEAIAA
jgi:antirestriction protein ArdC